MVSPPSKVRTCLLFGVLAEKVESGIGYFERSRDACVLQNFLRSSKLGKKKGTFKLMHGVIYTPEELAEIDLGEGSFWKGYLALKQAAPAPPPPRPTPAYPSGTSLLTKHGLMSSHRGVKNGS